MQPEKKIKEEISNLFKLTLVMSSFLCPFKLVFADEKSSSIDEIMHRKLEPRISRKYYRGSHLIYDCVDRNFACVNDESYSVCGVGREKSKENRLVKLDCAPLKKFKSQKECHFAYEKAIYQRADKRFCLNPKFF